MTTPDRDILISRVVEGRANQEDWSAVDTMASADPGLWRDIVQSQRDEQYLRRMVEIAGQAAESIDLPTALTVHGPSRVSSGRRSIRIGALGGWLVAAAVGIAFVQSREDRSILSGPTGNNQSSLAPSFANSDAAYKAYLKQGQKEGRVVGEVPEHYVLESTPAVDGKGYNVTFVRFIVERKTVADVVRPTQDETGALRALPFKMIVKGTVSGPTDTTPKNNPASSWD